MLKDIITMIIFNKKAQISAYSLICVFLVRKLIISFPLFLKAYIKIPIPTIDKLKIVI